MRKHMQPSDLGDLLEQPLVAVPATYRVWHRWRDGGFDLATG